MPAEGAALALEQISVTFVSHDGGRYTAIRDTTVRVAPGEFVCATNDDALRPADPIVAFPQYKKISRMTG